MIPGFGYVVVRKDKEAFLTELEALKQAVAVFKDRVTAKLSVELDKRAAELEKALMPALEKAPPSEWLLPEKPTIDQMRARLAEDLCRAIGSVEAYVGDMKVEVIFKDVTYESLCDQVFLAAARKALPDVKQIHAEFHVAAGSDAKTQTGSHIHRPLNG